MVIACRRRRILRIVAFIGVACAIFLCFQVFLVGFLDHDAHVGLRRGARPKFGPDNSELKIADVSIGWTTTTQYKMQLQQKLENECRSDNCSLPTSPPISTFHAVSQIRIFSSTKKLLNNSRTERSQFDSVWQLLEHKFSAPVFVQKNISEAHSTRGVNRRWQRLYEADNHMQFTCILSQVQLLLPTISVVTSVLHLMCERFLYFSVFNIRILKLNFLANMVYVC